MKGLLLISGGIDSPIAGYLMAKKGVEVIAIHFVNSEQLSKEQKQKIKALAEKSSAKKLYLVNNFENQKAFQENCHNRFQCILCKRTMFRIAEKIAEKENCDFIITGDNIGQVASQSLDNMLVISKAVKIPIVRPLLCNDKVETMAIARKVGTYDISIQHAGKCPFVPSKPATKSRVDQLEREEARVDIDKMIEKSVESITLV